MIEWEQYGLNLAYEATNGIDALHIIENNEVDLVITDIRMPLMDGIELTRKIKETYPEIKVMLLTCYNDFEYVREAVELNASCYLLKTDLEDGIIEKQLQKIVSEIKEERQLKQTFDELKKKVDETSNYLIERKIIKILKGEEELPTYHEDVFQWLHAPHLLVHVISPERNLSNTHLQEAVQKTVNDDRFIIVSINKNSWVILVSLPKQSFQREKVVITELYQAFPTDQVSIYYTVCSHLQFLSQTYKRLSERAETDFFYHGCSVIKSLDEFPVKTAAFKPLPLQTLSRWTILRDWIKVKELCDSVFDYFEENEIDKETVKVNVITLVETVMYGLQANSHLFTSHWGVNRLDFKERVKDIHRFEELKEWFYRGLEQLEEHRMQFIGGVHQVIKQAIAYIELHFHQEITLEDLSREVGLSKSYLSTLFKKEIGKSIVEYITELRMAKAKELILKSDLKIFEIAEKVGINDPKYFSKLFKRTVGLSPNEYKNKYDNNRKGKSSFM